MLDESESTFQMTTVKNLIQKCELFHQKELGIDHQMSTAEKAMEFLTRWIIMCFLCILIKGIYNSTTTLNRHEISCCVMYDDPEFALCATSKPRGKPRLSELVRSDSIVQSEIKHYAVNWLMIVAKSLFLWFLLLLMRWFGKLWSIQKSSLWIAQQGLINNKQKREFFFSVIRTLSGKCHLSNMPVIPSGELFARFVPTTIILSLTTTTINLNR